MSPDPRIGTTLAGYRIESVIGRGGMGVVYLAEHVRLKRKVALKVLAPELAEDEVFRDRFIHESELAASLDHPNIIDIHDAGEADGLLYLAMRYVSGPDLKTMIRQGGPLDPERSVSLLTQVAGALDAAHERGLVHRDIKTANVLVEPPTSSLGEHAYLTDFGLTKRPESMSGLTKTGQFLGSVEYAAPEQFEGNPLGPWTDVYSLGCVAYEALTGEVPYPKGLEAAVMHAHLHEPPPRVTARRPELPAGLDVAVATAMAKRPENRYRTAGAFARALAAGAGGEVPSPAGRPSRRRRAVAIGAAVALVLAVTATVLVVRSRSDQGTPPPRTAGRSFAGVVVLDEDGARLGPPIRLEFTHSSVGSEKQIAIGEGFLWVGDGSAGVVRKVSLTTRAVVFTTSVVRALGFAFANGQVWIPQGSPIAPFRSIVRIDPQTNSVSAPIDIGSTCCGGVAAEASSVWVLSANSLTRIDPTSGTVESTIDVAGSHIAAGVGSLWVLNPLVATLFEIDPGREQVVDRISLSGEPTAMAIGFEAAWVAHRDGTVSRIPLSGEGGIETIQVGSLPYDIAVGAEAVWVANAGDGTVSKIDGSGGEASSFRVGGFPTHLTVGADGVWVLIEDSLPRA